MNMKLFEKYVGWRILRHLCLNAGARFYVKQLSRILNVSPATVSYVLKSASKEGIAVKEAVGNTHLYRINSESPLARQMKVLLALAELESMDFTEKILAVEPEPAAVVLYGSHADGSFDERSDYDILIISSVKHDFSKVAIRIEQKLGKEVNIQCFTAAEWDRVRAKNKPFYDSVHENHLMLYGGGLP